MSKFKDVVKCEVWLDVKDTENYADSLGEFQRLIISIFQKLEEQKDVNVVWANAGEMEIHSDYKLIKNMEDGESHDSITFCNKK